MYIITNVIYSPSSGSSWSQPSRAACLFRAIDCTNPNIVYNLSMPLAINTKQRAHEDFYLYTQTTSRTQQHLCNGCSYWTGRSRAPACVLRRVCLRDSAFHSPVGARREGQCTHTAPSLQGAHGAEPVGPEPAPRAELAGWTFKWAPWSDSGRRQECLGVALR